VSIIYPDYFKTCLYYDDPLSGRQRVGRSLKLQLVGVVTMQRSLFTHVACSDAELPVVFVAKITEITELFALFWKF